MNNLTTIYMVGAGISNAVIARLFVDHFPDIKVHIYEQKNNVGGHCYDYLDKKTNVLVHKYGPHIFHTDNPKVISFVKRFASFSSYKHEVLAVVDQKDVHLPFSFYTIDDLFNKHEAQIIKNKLTKLFSINHRTTIFHLKECSDKDIKSFVNKVLNKIIIPYTTKQWDVSINKLDLAVISRIPVIIGYEKNYFNDKFQGIPIGGYHKMINEILNHKNIIIELNANLSSQNILNLSQKYPVFCSCPIDWLFNYEYGELEYRSLHFKFDYYDVNYYQKKGTINYPQAKQFTRISEYKHYLPHKTCQTKTIIATEYPGKYDKNNKLFNQRFYPTFTSKNFKTLKKYLTFKTKYPNIIMIGRLGKYRYFDMDDAILDSMEEYDKYINS